MISSPPARGKGVSNKSSALTRKIALLPFQQSCEVLTTFGVSTGRWLCDTKKRKSKVRQNASWHRIYVAKFSQENRKACISLLSIGNGKRKNTQMPYREWFFPINFSNLTVLKLYRFILFLIQCSSLVSSSSNSNYLSDIVSLDQVRTSVFLQLLSFWPQALCEGFSSWMPCDESSNTGAVDDSLMQTVSRHAIL